MPGRGIMSCNYCARVSQPAAAAVGAPDVEPAWAAGRGANGHCGRCGGWLRAADGGCTRCDVLQDTVTLSPAEREALAEADSLAAFLAETGVDPLDNEGVRRMYENYVSISSGCERRVVMDPRVGTGCTDLKGTVTINPYPLGKHGKVLDQMVINLGRIDHELLHEMFTPLDVLKEVQAIRRGRRKAFSHLTPQERALIPGLVNVLEDARIERLAERREPYMWGRILAKHRLEPKDGHVRGGGMARLAPYQQAVSAIQIVAQPNYHLAGDIRTGMSPEVLEAMGAIQPLIKRAVHGTSDEVVAMALEIGEELHRRGLLPEYGEMDLSMVPIHRVSAGEGADGSVTVAPAPGDWPEEEGEVDEGDEGGNGMGGAGCWGPQSLSGRWPD